MADEVLRSLENQVASVCMGAPSHIVRLRAGVVEKLEATVGRRAIVVRVPDQPLSALVAELARRVDGRPRAAVLVDPLVRELAGAALGEEDAGLAEFLTAEALDEVPALAGRVLLSRVAPVIATQAGVAPEVVAALISVRVGIGAFEVPAGDVLRALGRLAARAHVAIVLVGGDATLLEGAPGFVLVQEMQRAVSGTVVVAADETPAASLPVPAVAPVPVVAEPGVAPPPPSAPVVPADVIPPRAERSPLRKLAVRGLPLVFVASAGVFMLVEREASSRRAPSDVSPDSGPGRPAESLQPPAAVTTQGSTGQPAAPSQPAPSGANKPSEVPRVRLGTDRGPRPGHARPTPNPTKPEVSPEALQREVEAAHDPATKLWVIDRTIAEGSHAVVLAEIEQLYDRTPGTTDEGRDLRQGLLARLGVLRSDPGALDRLLAATAASSPQGERLMAVQALGRDGPRGLTEKARAQLDQLVAFDPDPVVVAASRRALGLPDQR